MFTFVGTKYSRQMASLDQLYNLVKQINEKLNLWTANAKKVEELPTMETMNPDGLLMVSEQVAGIWTSKQLEIQKIIDGLSLSGQDNKVREVLLGSITLDHDLAYLLDNNGITVSENEIVVITALETVNATLVQRQYLWKKGKGAYNPIGSTDINTKLIELQPRFLNEITADELTSSPSAIVYDFGIITDPILDVLNTADPARDYTDDERIYYIRATKDGVNLLYNFVGTNGTYGLGETQMTEADLVLVYSSASVDITDSLLNKLDKGSFYGTADDLIDKNTYSWTNVNTLSGVVVDYVNPFVGMSINFKDAVTELHSLSFPTVAKRPYFGALGFIKNSQTIDILIPHKELSLVANRYVFAFPDEQDLILKPNEILFFKADPDETHSFGYLDCVGVMIDKSNVVYKTGGNVIEDTNEFTEPVIGVPATAPEHLTPLSQVRTEIQTATLGLWDDRGGYTVVANEYPTTGGSGVSGAILKGDIWTISGTGLIGSIEVEAGDTVRALIDSPTQSPSDWNIQQNNIGYTPENAANKSNDIEADKASTSKYGSVKAFYDWAVGKFQSVLISGTNIKTINGSSILGSGDMAITVDSSSSIGSVIDLGNPSVNYYNMGESDDHSFTAYTLTNIVNGGKARLLVNSPTLPTITGATNIKGDDFQANTDIYLEVQNSGGRIEYWVKQIYVNPFVDLTALPFGVVVNESTTANVFFGTPAILKTSSGRVLLSHDKFGSASTYLTSGITSVYYSDNIDTGEFTLAQDISNMFWASLFEYSGDLYLLGVSKQSGNITISKSTDNGLTWSGAVTVLNAPTGAFTYVGWQKGSDNVIFKDGYLVCPIEACRNAGDWAGYLDAVIVFANLSDLMNPSNWSYSNIVPFNGANLEANLIAKNEIATKQPANATAYKGFLEGSLIELASGNLRMFMRLEQTPNSNHAVYMDVAWNSLTPPSSVLGSTQNIIDLLGGNVNFQVKYDAVSDKHWTLVNANRYKYYTDQRAEVYLASSSDEGLTWNYHGKVLGYDVTVANWQTVMAQNAVQYSSFEIVGSDLIVSSRTASDSAANYHDSNICSLAKIKNFRSIATQSFVSGSMIIDENSERLEDSNGIAIIRDRSVHHNSPFMLAAQNANKPNWVSGGIQFDGSSWLRLMHSERLSLGYGTGMSVFAVIENLQVEFYRRILSNDDGVVQANTSGKGGWWFCPENGLGVEQSFPTYIDLTAGNNYIIAASFDKSNHFIYNYKNGMNRGNPTGSNANVTWSSDHLITSLPYSGTNYKEILIGKRNIGASTLAFTSKIKALHIIPSYMTPAEMIAYQNALNGIYGIY